MVNVICLFPAIVSVGLFEKIMKVRLSKRSIVYLYALNTLLINFICFGIKTHILGTGNVPFIVDSNMLPAVAFNYLIMEGATTLMVTILEALVYKNIRFKIEDINK